MATDDLPDDLFTGCAWAAYLDQMRIEQQWPPNSEATRRLAYRYYEEALAEKNRRRAAPPAEVNRALTNPNNRAKAHL